MKWHNLDSFQPPKPLNGPIELVCKVRGLPFTEHLICRWDGEFWWSYLPPGLFDNFGGGWVGLPRGAEITYWAYIEPL